MAFYKNVLITLQISLRLKRGGGGGRSSAPVASHGYGTASTVVQFFTQNQMKSKKKKVITSADVHLGTIQWDDLSEIRNFFVVPLKLLRGPQVDPGPQFENHWYTKYGQM